MTKKKSKIELDDSRNGPKMSDSAVEDEHHQPDDQDDNDDCKTDTKMQE